MGPVQTLHEFVLNLLSDPQGLADFNADPQGVLNAADLGDVSPADVHDILPLVMDTAPASVTEALGSFAAGGDVAGTLDSTVATVNETGSQLVNDVSHVAAGPLGDLPNLSGVFGAASDLAGATGLNAVAVDTLGTTSGLVHGVADAFGNVPVVGPLLNSADIDLQNTVSAVSEHESDGKLVGAVVDATTNHLGDAVLWPTAVDTVSQLPVVGPLGGLVEEVRVDGGALFGITNESIGSTSVGVPSGQALAAEFNSGGDFSATGDLAGTLDHVTSAVPATVAIPATPAIPAVPAVSDAVGSVTHTVSGVTANVPVVGSVVDNALGSVGGSSLPDIHDVTIADTHVSTIVNDVDTLAHDLNIAGDLTDGQDLHGATGLLDDLHLGH